jgi:hypothetical protein
MKTRIQKKKQRKKRCKPLLLYLGGIEMKLIFSPKEYKKYNTSKEFREEIISECGIWFDKGIETIDLVCKRDKVFKTITPDSISEIEWK